MNYPITAAILLLLLSPQPALDGQPGIHDPSTIAVHDGKYYTYATGAGLPILGLRRWLDVAARGRVDERGARRAPGRHRARRQQHLGAGHHPRRRQVLRVLLCPGHPAEIGDRPARRQDARPGIPRLQVGGRRPGRLVRRRRGQQRHRSWCVARSHRRPAVAHLRLLLRLHPSRRAGPEDRQAAPPGTPAHQHRDQLRSVDHDSSRRLVLPARHARVVLRERELQLQHPHGPLPQRTRPVPRQHGH